MSPFNKVFIGHHVIHLDSTDSTNNYTAKLLANNEVGHGAVIMAVEQTDGRGQRGATWLSNPGENLLMTVVLQPANLSLNHQFRLTQFASLALRDLLFHYGLEAQIKWPNDLYVGKRKISGMLIENQVSAGNISHVLLGIGLNVNQIDFGRLNATSICIEKQLKFALPEVASLLFSKLNHYWNMIENQLFLLLDEQYQGYLYLRNVPARFTDDKGDFEGKILGTTDQGLLAVRGRANKLVHYDLKQLRFKQQNDL